MTNQNTKRAEEDVDNLIKKLGQQYDPTADFVDFAVILRKELPIFASEQKEEGRREGIEECFKKMGEVVYANNLAISHTAQEQLYRDMEGWKNKLITPSVGGDKEGE